MKKYQGVLCHRIPIPPVALASLGPVALMGLLACSGGSRPEDPSHSERAAKTTLEESGDPMGEEEVSTIESIRAEYEALLMAIPGVVLVGTGLGADEKPCLMIGTSRPVDEVREQLPEEIFQVPVELNYLGDIEAQ